MILLVLVFLILNLGIFSDAEFSPPSPLHPMVADEPPIHHHLGYILQQRVETLNEESINNAGSRRNTNVIWLHPIDQWR